MISVSVSTSAEVTNSDSCNASAATETPPTTELSGLSYTGGSDSFSRISITDVVTAVPGRLHLGPVS